MFYTGSPPSPSPSEAPESQEPTDLPPRDPEAAQHRLDVVPSGADADRKGRRDLFVRPTLGEEHGHLCLSRREPEPLGDLDWRR